MFGMGNTKARRTTNVHKVNKPAPHIYSAADLGTVFRAEREVLGLTQAQAAKAAKCRRQTIAAIEAGENVRLFTLLSALTALGKRLEIRDARLEMDRLQEMFNDDEG